MSAGADYAFHPHPSPAALRAFGCRWVGRYVSRYPPNDGNGKNLLRAERDALIGAGIAVVVFAEEGARAMAGGYAAGEAMGEHAAAVTHALGLDGIPVFLCADDDFAPADQPALNACLDGAASVLGRPRVGIYGGYYPVHRALDAGKAAYALQTYAWSAWALARGATGDHRGRALVTAHDQGWVPPPAPPEWATWEPAAALAALPPHTVAVDRIAGRALPGRFLFDDRVGARQGPGATIGGASCDLDEAVAADFGQWPRPAAPPDQGQEEDEEMAMLEAGPGAETVIKFSGGSKTYITFLNDCLRCAAEAPRLRVAVHPTDDAAGWRVGHVTLTASGADTYPFPVRANGLTVVRDGAGDDVPVGYALGA